jgi:hypothetical protein
MTHKKQKISMRVHPQQSIAPYYIYVGKIYILSIGAERGREGERERKREKKKEIDRYQAEGRQLYGRPASAALVRTSPPASQS